MPLKKLNTVIYNLDLIYIELPLQRQTAPNLDLELGKSCKTDSNFLILNLLIIQDEFERKGCKEDEKLCLEKELGPQLLIEKDRHKSEYCQDRLKNDESDYIGTKFYY